MTKGCADQGGWWKKVDLLPESGIDAFFLRELNVLLCLVINIALSGVVL